MHVLPYIIQCSWTDVFQSEILSTHLTKHIFSYFNTLSVCNKLINNQLYLMDYIFENSIFYQTFLWPRKLEITNCLFWTVISFH